MDRALKAAVAVFIVVFCLVVAGVSHAADGKITIHILPQEAVAAGAQWSLNAGLEWYDNGETVSGLGADLYTVTLKAAPPYTTPSAFLLELAEDAHEQRTVIYGGSTGELRMNIAPAEIAGNALWSPDNGAHWYGSGVKVELTTGTYAVRFSNITGWITPDNRDVTVPSGGTLSENAEYTKNAGSLRVLLVSSDTDAPLPATAAWRIAGTETWRASGYTLLDLSPAQYTVEFRAVSGYATPVPTNLSVTGGSLTTHTATYDRQVASITGRIIDENEGPVHFSSVRLTYSGGYLAYLVDLDPDGRFAITDIPVGRTYTISVYRSEYEFQPPVRTLPVTQAKSYDVGVYSGKYRLANLSISGKVATTSGKPVDGMTVQLGGSTSTKTLEGGRFAFHNLARGKYQVHILPGATYAAGTTIKNVTLTNSSKTLDFTVENVNLEISGKVLGFDGAGIPDVLVQLTGPNGESNVASKKNGSYTFKKLRSGSYTISLLSPPLTFRSTRHDVELDDAKVGQIDFVQENPVLTSVKVGALTIAADSITQLTANTYRASGNIAIGSGKLIRADVDLLLDTAAGSITGDGAVYLNKIPGIGNVALANGAFEISANGVNVFGLKPSLNLGLLKLTLDSFALAEAGTTVGATVEMNFIVRTVELSAELRFNKNGAELQSFSGTISQIPLGPWELEDTNIFYQKQNKVFGGGTTLVAQLFSLESAVAFYQGRLDAISFSLSRRIPLYAPYLYLTRIAGGVENLVSDNPIVINAEADFEAGERLGDRAMATIEGTLAVVLSGSFTIEAALKILGIEAGNATVSYTHNPNRHLSAAVDFTLGALPRADINGEINLTFDPFNVWGSSRVKLAFKALGERFNIGNASGEFTKNEISIRARVLGAKLAAEIDGDGFRITQPKWARSVKISLPGAVAAEVVRKAAGSLVFADSDVQTYTAPAGLGEAHFLVAWQQGDDTPSVVAPDGTVYDGSDNGRRYEYEVLPESRLAGITIYAPDAGIWTVRFPDDASVGKTSLVVSEYAPEAGAAITEVAELGTNQWRISLIRSGFPEEKVELFYAPTDQPDRRERIATSEELGDAFEWDWDAGMVRPGSYLLSVRVYDESSFPIFVQFGTPVTVVGDEALRIQGIPVITARKTGLQVRWNHLAAADLVLYRCYFSDDLASTRYDRFVDIDPERATVTLDDETIKPGRRYKLAVAAVFASGSESPLSAPKRFTYRSKGNNYPYIASAPEETVDLGDMYKYSVKAKDLDREQLYYRLLKAPSGMRIDPLSGLITWDTATAASGAYTVALRVSDGGGHEATQRYTMQVNDPAEKGSLSVRRIRDARGADAFLIACINPSLNRNTRSIEALPARISAAAAPSPEKGILLRESGENSGVFTAVVRLNDLIQEGMVRPSHSGTGLIRVSLVAAKK